MPPFFDSRKRPTGVQVHVSTGKGVDIQWSDGHASHFEFAYLREKCPCATCNEEREKKASAPVAGSAAGLPGLPGLGPALPMFKPKPAARQAKTVGQYALQFDFNDGHSTGIYSFEFLRTICPCQQCAADFRSAAPPEA